MATALKLRTKGTNEFPQRVKDEDGWMIFLITFSFMDNVDLSGLIDGHVMGGLPIVLGR